MAKGRRPAKQPARETIFRTHKEEDPFVRVDRGLVNDKRLTWATRGLLIYIIGKPNNWEVRLNELIHASPAGLEAIRRILKEAEAFGYIHRRGENRGGGLFEWVTHVYESPNLNPHFTLPSAGFPSMDQPSMDQPSMDQPSMDQPSMENPPIYKPMNLLTNEFTNGLFSNEGGDNDDDDAFSSLVKADLHVGSYPRGDHAHDATRTALLAAANEQCAATIGNAWDNWPTYRDRLTNDELHLFCYWCKRLACTYEQSDSIHNPAGFVRDGVKSGALPGLIPSDQAAVDSMIDTYIDLVKQGLFAIQEETQ